jgi:hypothetical protein
LFGRAASATLPLHQRIFSQGGNMRMSPAQFIDKLKNNSAALFRLLAATGVLFSVVAILVASNKDARDAGYRLLIRAAEVIEPYEHTRSTVEKAASIIGYEWECHVMFTLARAQKFRREHPGQSMLRECSLWSRAGGAP